MEHRSTPISILRLQVAVHAKHCKCHPLTGLVCCDKVAPLMPLDTFALDALDDEKHPWHIDFNTCVILRPITFRSGDPIHFYGGCR